MGHIGLIQILMLGTIQVADGMGIQMTVIIQIRLSEQPAAYAVASRVG